MELFSMRLLFITAGFAHMKIPGYFNNPFCAATAIAAARESTPN
jgi:hypothetical protein